MDILLAFAPFFAFFLIERFLDKPLVALVAGAVVSAILVAREIMRGSKQLKVLEVGTMILFAGLALYTLLTKATWSIMSVRLCVDTGLLVLVLVSMAIRRPFTLPYAREKSPPEIWKEPEFIRTNYIITAVWAAAFVVMVLADLVLLYLPGVRPAVGIIVTIAAIYGAVKFTGWYPERNKPPVG